MVQNTRESAIDREQFHQLLRSWLDESFDNRIGEESHSGSAWLWVRHGGDHFYLDADSTRAGIRRYLAVVDQSRGDPEWFTNHSNGEARDRVSIGRDRQIIAGFDFYRHVPRR